MTDIEIVRCAQAIISLACHSGSKIDDILEVLKGNIISEEDCGSIKREIKKFETYDL